MGGYAEEYAVPYTSPSWEQDDQSHMRALPNSWQRPLLHGAADA